MYKENRDFFSREKLSLMVSAKDKENVCFPSSVDPKIVAPIESVKAIVLGTVLRAGFNLSVNETPSISFKENKDDSISIMFGEKEIQKIVIKDINKTPDIQKEVEKDLKKSSSQKTTFVFVDKDAFLKNDNGLQSYFTSLQNLDKTTTHSVSELRSNLLSTAGIYIEEYEDKLSLKPTDALDINEVSHHNTFSNPIVYKVENMRAIEDHLEKVNDIGVCSDKISITTSLSYGVNTPTESFNPINNVSNSRDIDLAEIKSNKIDNFLDTLVDNAISYYQAQDKKEKVKDKKEISRIEESMRSYLKVSGNSKQLYSLGHQKADGKSSKNEIFIHNYKDKTGDYICINSKGTCLGNGQHSTTTFKILDLILFRDAKSESHLIEKLNMSPAIMTSIFGKSGSGAYRDYQNDLIKKIEKPRDSGSITFAKFTDYFQKLQMQVEWSIFDNEKRLRQAIINDNAQKEQYKGDEWINAKKEFINTWLAKYKEVNKKDIQRYSSLDKEHKFSNLNINLDLVGVKTVDSSPSLVNHTKASTTINDIFSYLTFVAPTTKNLSTYENKNYTQISNKKQKNSRDNLRNIYQSDTVGENWHLFWNDLFTSYFKKSNTNSAFESFLDVAVLEHSVKSEILDENCDDKNKKFFKLGYHTQIDGNAIKKVPAIIVFKELAQKYFVDVIDNTRTTPQFKDAISPDNFVKTCFYAYVSKIGKEQFTIENVEKYGELILKDVCNAFHEYYVNTDDAVITDALKRNRNKEIKPLTDKHSKIADFGVALFEPYINNINNSEFDKTLIKNLRNKDVKGTWLDGIKQKEKSIEASFSKNFEDIDVIKKPSRTKRI